jgi:hypothetical protein
MPGIRIGVDVSGGMTSLKDFQDALQKTGAASKLTVDELAKLEQRFVNKLAADKAKADLDATSKSIDQIGRAAGISGKELADLQTRLGGIAQKVKESSSALEKHSEALSSMGRGLGVVTSALGTLATAFSAVKISEYLMESASLGARYETLGVVIKVVGENAGYNAMQMNEFASAIQKSGISMIESREALAKLATAHVDLTKSAELARAAQDAAVISGRNSSEAFGLMTQAIANGQAILLHHMGVMVDFEGAYKRAGEAIGGNAHSLTQNEQIQVRTQEVLDKTAASAGAYAAAMETAGKQITSFTRYLQDFQTILGSAFNESTFSVVSTGATTMKQLQDEISSPQAQKALASLGEGIEHLANNITTSIPGMMTTVISGLDQITKWWSTLDPTLRVLMGAAAGAAGAAPVALAASFANPALGLGILATGAVSGGAATWGLSKLFPGVDKQIDELKKELSEKEPGGDFWDKLSPYLSGMGSGYKPKDKGYKLTGEEREDAQAKLDSLEAYRWQLRYNKGVKDARKNMVAEGADEGEVYNKFDRDGNSERAAANAVAIRAKEDKEAREKGAKELADYLSGGKAGRIASAKEDYEKAMGQAVMVYQGSNKSSNMNNWLYEQQVAAGKVRDETLAKIQKEGGAGKAARYGATEDSFVKDTDARVAGILGGLTGGTDSTLDKVNEEFTKLFGEITRHVADAKGDTTAYREEWVKLVDVWAKAGEQAKNMDFAKLMELQGKQMSEMAGFTGDPRQAMQGNWLRYYSQYIKERQSSDPTISGMADAKWSAAQSDVIQKGLGDGAKLTDDYWNKRKANLQAEIELVKANASSEYAARVYASQQIDKLNHDQLEARIGYEKGFVEYVADEMSLEHGTYKTARGQELQAWQEYFTAIKGIADTAFDAIGKSIEQVLGKLTTKTRIQDFTKAIGEDLKQAIAKGAGGLANSLIHDVVLGGGSGVAGMFGGNQGGDTRSRAITSGLTGLIDPTASQVLVQNAMMNGATGFWGGTLAVNAMQSSGGQKNAFSQFIPGMPGATGAASGSGAGMPMIFTVGSDGSIIPISLGGGSSSFSSSGGGYPVYAGSGGSPFAVQSGGQAGFQTAGGIIPPTPSSSGGSSLFSPSNILSALKSGNMLNSLDQWGMSSLGMGTLGTGAFTGLQAGDAIVTLADGSQVAMSTSALAGTAFPEGATVAMATPAQVAGSNMVVGGLGGTIAGAGMGMLGGGLVGSLLSPNNPTPSYIGMGAGALAGGISAAAGIGSGSALAGALGLSSLGGPIGLAVGAIAAGIAALASGSSSSTSPDGDNGNMVAYNSGNLSMGGYMGFRTTTSGLGGSESTSHWDAATFADPTLARQWNQGIIAPTASVTSASDLLGFGNSSALNFNVGAFPINSSDMQQAIYNVSNAMAQSAIQASGLQSAFNACLEPGEMYVDELQRIGSAYAAINTAAGNAGLNLQSLTGGSNVVTQGNWASQAANLMGGDSAVTTALQMYGQYALSNPQIANATLASTGAQANQQIASLGAAGLNTSNFWGQYGNTLNNNPSPQQFQQWSTVATYVSQYDNAQRQMIASQQAVNTLQVQADQAQIQSLNDQKVLINGVDQTIQSAFSTWQSMSVSLTNSLNGIQWNSSLSPETPQQTYSQESAYWNQLVAKVQGEDMSSPTYTSDVQQLQSFAQTFLTTSKNFYGISQQYLNDYNNVTGVLSGLQTGAASEVNLLGQQLTAQNAQLNALNTQIAALNLANANLSLVANNVDALGTDLTSTVNSLGIATTQAQANTSSSGDAVYQNPAISPDGSTDEAVSGATSSATSSTVAASYAQGAPTVAQVAAAGGTTLDDFLAQSVANGTATYTASGGYDLSGGATGGLIRGGIAGKDSAVVRLMPGEVVTSAPEVQAVKQAIHNGTSGPATNAHLHKEMERNTRVAAAGHQTVAAGVHGVRQDIRDLTAAITRQQKHIPARARA